MRSIITILTTSAAAIAVTGCEVEKTQDAELPDVDVAVESGQLPKFEIEQTQEAKLPDVDVDVESGQLPEFEVEVADIEVGKKEVTVPVPEVEMKDKSVTVPTIGIEMPDERDMAEEKREKEANERAESSS